MKVVLLHDWLTGFRGGERVLEALCELFPEAPIYTLIHEAGSTSATIESRRIHTSPLQKIPGISKSYRKFLPLFPKAAESLSLPEDTDLVISSSHCVIKGVRKPARAKHLCYIHSPMRYLYDQYDVYFGPSAPWTHRWGMKAFRSYLTNWDLASNSQVDHFVANSGFVGQRVRTIYQREAEIIHAFVELADFAAVQANPPEREDFHLMVTAFAPNKRVDLAIEAFKGTGRKLKIVGSGQDETRLRAMAGPETEFLGAASRQEVISLFARARSLIFPGVEDFGITPLESLAAGTPVTAFHAGGVLETLTPETATFFHEPTIASLREAVQTTERTAWSRPTLQARAQDFSREKFLQRIQSSAKHLLGR